MPDNRFFLGSTTLETAAPAPSRRFGSLRAWIIGLALVFGIGCVTVFVIGAQLTQALRFENAPISFFQGVRLVGAGLFASPRDLKGYAEGRINILLLGRAGERYPGKHLTDTVMVASLDTRAGRVALLSLPRDLLAPLPEGGTAKLNTLYQTGLIRGEGADLARMSVSEMTGLPIHYFASIDFDGFERLIDALGGIRVEVKRNIYDTRYPGPNYSYETFELSKGWHELDGKTALKYARMRHDDPEGDFGRAKRQQEILQALRDEAWSLPTFLNPLTVARLLESLGESVKTDIDPEAARGFLALAESIDTRSIETAVVDAWKKESLLRVTHVGEGPGRAFALTPRSGDWREVRSLAQSLFDQSALRDRRTRIEQEAASLLILVPPKQLALGRELGNDLRETFPVGTVTVQAWSRLENQTGNAIIERTGDARKLYTLDSLIGRYALERQESLPASLPTGSPATDLVLLYTRDTIPGLIHEVPPTDMGDFAASDI